MADARPNVLWWLYYAYGGKLPHRYAQWVLHDLTCRLWLVRHFARTVMQCLPSLLLMLLPGPLSLRLMLPLLVLSGAMYISLALAWETRKHRLMKHGFIPDLVLDDED